MATTLYDKTREILALYEAELKQNIPITDRSFLYQYSLANASLSVSIDKKAILAVRENLAITATRNGLTIIGRQELNRDPYSSVPATIEAEFSVDDGVVVPVGTAFVSEETRLTYTSITTVIGTVTGTAILTLKCELAGAETNVTTGSIVSIQSPIIGVSDDGTVTSTTVQGVSEEGTEEYRTKVLDAIRAQGGGSNMWDYRIWAQQTPGVKRAYPYGGEFDASGADIGGPSSRTVFIQATEDIDPDGIAPQSLLDSAREYILQDPVTLRNRICGGVPDATLFVESIKRQSFDVRVLGSTPQWPQDAITAIEEAVSDYLLGIVPTIEGVDPVAGRTKSITNVGIANVVHDATESYGVSASSVWFDLAGETVGRDIYELPSGTLAKLNNITFP
jgi:hypothetical protein